ncbi:MAG TPA: trigger factor [Proteobacteria bacterium]|nr:trigger factor [Pseudomonadota bacterium]
MKVDIDSSHEARWRIAVEVPNEEVEKEFRRQYQKLNKSIQIKGFRRGKAPRSLLERYYGDQVREIVIDTLVERTLKKMIEEKGIDLVSPPEVESADIEDGVLKYTVIVEVLPQFELKDYSGIEIVLPRAEVTGVDVEEELQEIRRRHAKLKEVDRQAAWNDYVDVRIEAHDADGVLLFKEDSYTILLREETRPKEVVKSLIGAKKGDRLTVKDSFPKSHPEPMLRGREATFELEVLAVKEAMLPELDDEFAKDMGYESLEALREFVRNELKEMKERDRKSKAFSQIADALIAKHIFELPPAMVEQELNALSQRAVERLSLTIGAAAARDFVDGRREEFRKQAQERVRLNLILDRIAEKEGIEVSEQDLDEEVEKIAQQAGQPKEKVKGTLAKSGRLEGLKRQIARNRVMELLLERAQIAEEEGEGEESA